jgi:hypothetical protein
LRVPLRLRLGSLEQCNRLEQKWSGLAGASGRYTAVATRDGSCLYKGTAQFRWLNRRL